MPISTCFSTSQLARLSVEVIIPQSQLSRNAICQPSPRLIWPLAGKGRSHATTWLMGWLRIVASLASAGSHRFWMHVFEADRDSIPLLAPDGLTVIIMPRPSLITKLRRSSCLFLPIYGITTLPSFILSALTIKCILASIPHRGTHPTGNSFHVCLKKTPTSESGTHELAILFPSFQRPRWMELPSHLFWPIPLARHSLLLASNVNA